MLNVLRSACILSGTPIYPIGKKTEKRVYLVIGDTEIWPLFQSYVDSRHKFLAKWKAWNRDIACKLMEATYNQKISQEDSNNLANLADYLLDVHFGGHECLPPAPLIENKDAKRLNALLKKVGLKLDISAYVDSYEKEWNKLDGELKLLEHEFKQFRENN